MPSHYAGHWLDAEHPRRTCGLAYCDDSEKDACHARLTRAWASQAAILFFSASHSILVISR
jgi:hypothetical protein